MGNIFGYILGSVNKIMEPLSAVFGAGGGLVPKIQGSVLGFLGEVLSFLSCQNDSECPEVTKWSMGGGYGTKTENFPADVQGVLDQAKNIGTQISELADPDEFSFNLDFGPAIKNSIENCNVGPILCGPPTLEFFGGGGTGAQGNVIVSATGEILGIDMVSFGKGYKKAPIAKIVDACGRGNGAVLLPILGSNQDGQSLNKTRIKINKDPNDDDNPTITFSGGTKEIVLIDNPVKVKAKSSIRAKWKLIGPREVSLEVTGEGSAQIRIDLVLDDDPNSFGSCFDHATIKGTLINFHFGDGTRRDDDEDTFTPGTYKFRITGLIQDLELDNYDKTLILRDNDGDDANATFSITQIIQNDYIKETNDRETEVITTPLTVRDNLNPFEPSDIIQDYDYPRIDDGNAVANPCAANTSTNITRITSYELFENYKVDNPGFTPKVNGEWVNHNYGGAANLWSGENDFIESLVNLEGGSGYGMQVLDKIRSITW